MSGCGVRQEGLLLSCVSSPTTTPPAPPRQELKASRGIALYGTAAGVEIRGTSNAKRLQKSSSSPTPVRTGGDGSLSLSRGFGALRRRKACELPKGKPAGTGTSRRAGSGERRHLGHCAPRPPGGAPSLGLRLPSAPAEGAHKGASGARRGACREL